MSDPSPKRATAVGVSTEAVGATYGGQSGCSSGAAFCGCDRCELYRGSVRRRCGGMGEMGTRSGSSGPLLFAGKTPFASPDVGGCR